MTVQHLAGAGAYREIDGLLAEVLDQDGTPAAATTAEHRRVMRTLAAAQVRATQAQAGATALLAIVAAGGTPGPALLAWADTLGVAATPPPVAPAGYSKPAGCTCPSWRPVCRNDQAYGTGQ